MKNTRGLGGWSLSSYHAFQILIVFRFISVFYNNINDCDETYNYWEPVNAMHYVLYQIRAFPLGSLFGAW